MPTMRDGKITQAKCQTLRRAAPYELRIRPMEVQKLGYPAARIRFAIPPTVCIRISSPTLMTLHENHIVSSSVTAVRFCWHMQFQFFRATFDRKLPDPVCELPALLLPHPIIERLSPFRRAFGWNQLIPIQFVLVHLRERS